jgi:hypothetical protein
MFSQKELARRAALSVAGTLISCALPLAASAADPTDILAGYIAQQVGANGFYKAAKFGNDWCFNTERELGYTWWYYDQGDGKGLVAHQIINTIRIQATYTDASGMTRYASVFLGLDTNGDSLPPSLNVLDVLPGKATPKAPTLEEIKESMKTTPRLKGGPPPFATGGGGVTTTPENTLTVPSNSASSSCQTFGAFLMSYALPSTPLMKTDTTLQKPEWLQDAPSFSSYGGPGDPNARYWVFNSRPHTVLNVMSYRFGLAYSDANNNTTLYPKINLVVGIGGGAGP